MREFLGKEEVSGSIPDNGSSSNKPKALSAIGAPDPSDEALIDRFLSEKRYLENVSEATLEIYQYSFKAFHGAMGSIEAVKARIIELRKAGLRKAGLSACSVNTYLRHVKCFYLWQGKEWKLPWLKEEQKVLATFSKAQVGALIHWKPAGGCGGGGAMGAESRLKTLALTAVDTGLRIDELLSLERRNVSFENLTLLVRGKGGKERFVPFSIELRKVMFMHLTGRASRDMGGHELVFCTAGGLRLSQRNVLRDFKLVCKRLGIQGVRASFHTLRHTMAVSYLRAGGNLFYLSRILGHSSLITTQRYLQSLGVEDLSAVHSKFSPLSPLSNPRR